MQECVDKLGTLHHDHVTAVLQDLQEGHQEDLTHGRNKRRLHFYLNVWSSNASTLSGHYILNQRFVSL